MKNADILVLKTEIDYHMLTQVELLTRNSTNSVLYIIFETGGGLPIAAMKAMEIIDSRYKEIYAIVFNVAMSAGTLMCLGCDKIYMDDGACLGPLDLQIPHPSDDTQISTLDVRDTMLSLMSQTTIIAQQFTEEHIKMGISKTTAVKMSYDAAIKLVTPIANKIDPYHYRESFRNSETGAVYGCNLLSRRMMKDKPELAEAVALHLANRYMAHNYMIFKKEAKEKLRLNVEHTDKLPGFILEAAMQEWNNIASIFIDPANKIYLKEVNNDQQEQLDSKTSRKEEGDNVAGK